MFTGRDRLSNFVLLSNLKESVLINHTYIEKIKGSNYLKILHIGSEILVHPVSL